MNKRLLTIITVTLFFHVSCRRKPIQIDRWKHGGIYTDYTYYEDTIGAMPYNNPYLRTILYYDSLLKSCDFNDIPNRKKIGEHDLLSHSKIFEVHEGKLHFKAIEVNLYLDPSPSNHVMLYSDKYGIIEFWVYGKGPVFLDSRIINGQTIRLYDIQERLFWDSIPVPPPPSQVIPEIIQLE